MSDLNLEVFEKREDEEKKIMKRIFELEEELVPVVKEGDIIEFEISRNQVEDDNIKGKYEIIVVEKTDEKLELAIKEAEDDYEDIILFSELGLLLDSKLIKVLIFAIKMNTIGNAINKMNETLWDDALTIKHFYL